MRDTGQMLRSIRFTVRKDGEGGTIKPTGTRTGTKQRKGFKNFSIAAFHAARGIDLIGLTSADQIFFLREVELELERILDNKRSRST